MSMTPNPTQKAAQFQCFLKSKTAPKPPQSHQNHHSGEFQLITTKTLAFNDVISGEQDSVVKSYISLRWDG